MNAEGHLQAELRNHFRPSHAVKSDFGPRQSNHEDGPTYCYLAKFSGNSGALLGKEFHRGESKAILKIGVTNNLKRRLNELNSGFSPATDFKWEIRLKSQSFENKEAAEVVEQKFKEQAEIEITSLGKEFFLGELEKAESIFRLLPNMSRF